MPLNKRYIAVESLHLREKPSTSSKSLGIYRLNEAVTLLKPSEKISADGCKWQNVEITTPRGTKQKGYMACEVINGQKYLSSSKTSSTGKKESNENVSNKNDTTQQLKETPTTAPGDSTNNTSTITDDDVNMYSDTPYASYEGFNQGEKINAQYQVDTFNVKDLLIDNIVGIYGMPYQFLPTVDIRLKNTDDVGATNQAGIGRKYAEKIVSTMPLVLFTPGVPKFLKNYSNEEREGILNRLLDFTSPIGNLKNEINDILGKPGRYYTFDFNYAQYFNYVESALWAGANLMGIEEEKVTIGNETNKLKRFKWRNATNNKLSKYIVGDQYIPFYVESIDSINESFSTDTTQSSLAGSLNNLSDLAREVQFLTGNYTNHTVGIQNMEDYNSAMESLNNLLSKSIFKKSKFVESIAGTATTIAAGGKLYFPEIWSDTTFTKSYDIGIKLRTPDGDMLSWYLNIFVPLIHLICMAAPREMKNPNMYMSPFLIRAYYKGIFSCDMGIITGLDITKGKEGSWTLDGLPTEVDVNIQLKDLYSVFSMSDAVHDSVKFVKNIGMIDYIASTCGVNINKPELTRSLDLYLMLKGSVFANIPNRVWTSIKQGLDDVLKNILLKFDFGRVD